MHLKGIFQSHFIKQKKIIQLSADFPKVHTKKKSFRQFYFPHILLSLIKKIRIKNLFQNHTNIKIKILFKLIRKIYTKENLIMTLFIQNIKKIYEKLNK